MHSVRGETLSHRWRWPLFPDTCCFSDNNGSAEQKSSQGAPTPSRSGTGTGTPSEKQETGSRSCRTTRGTTILSRDTFLMKPNLTPAFRRRYIYSVQFFPSETIRIPVRIFKKHFRFFQISCLFSPVSRRAVFVCRKHRKGENYENLCKVRCGTE